MADLPPLYDQSDYEALREEKDQRIADLKETIARQTESALDANEALYVKGERIAALEAIVGKQEEELHQGELRVADLEARIKRDEKYRDELLERRAESVERAELAEATVEAKRRTIETLVQERRVERRLISHLVNRAEQAEATVERLRCCGNCAGSGHHGGAFGCFKDVDHLFVNTEPSDCCHYDPSLWKEGTP